MEEVETTIETKTFREVHQDIHDEFLFLNQKHNYSDFREKATFLEDIGFTNSIATRLYRDVSSTSNQVREFNTKYENRYKMLLESQLERLCEKYDLYVRTPEFFVGDIPENNVRELMGFGVFISDLSNSYQVRMDISKNYNMFLDRENTRSVYETNKLVPLVKTFHGNQDIMIPFKHFKAMGLNSLIEIAAVKQLFSKQAFAVSSDRIISRMEISPKSRVALDPIILCRIASGRIVVTAWGDEANDELVVKQNNN